MNYLKVWGCLLVGLGSLGSFATDGKSLAEDRQYKMVFTEDLRLTADDGEDYIFSTTMFDKEIFISADKDGNMYVADPGQNKITVFDKQGKRVKHIGGAGHGPADFKMLARYQVIDRGGIASDHMFLRTYDHELNIIDNVNLMTRKMMLLSIYFDGEGERAIAVIPEQNNGVITNHIKIVNRQLEELLPISSYTAQPLPFKEDVSQVTKKDMEVVLDNFMMMGVNAGMAAFLSDGRVVTARKGAYKIDVYDKSLKAIKEITQAVKPRFRPAEEVEALGEVLRGMLPIDPAMNSMITTDLITSAMEKAGLDKAPALYGLVALADGGFLAIHHLTTYGSAQAHIYDKECRLVGSTQLGNWAFIGKFSMMGYHTPKMEFQNGYAYTIEEVNDDFELVRYKYAFVPDKK